MTVFEPTTPHRDRLAEALFKARHPGVETPPSDWWHRQMLQEADYLIEADVVADPEFVAWLAEIVTRMKGMEGRLRKQIAADIESFVTESHGEEHPEGTCEVCDLFGSVPDIIARGDHEAATHTIDNKGDDHG